MFNINLRSTIEGLIPPSAPPKAVQLWCNHLHLKHSNSYKPIVLVCLHVKKEYSFCNS